MSDPDKKEWPQDAPPPEPDPEVLRRLNRLQRRFPLTWCINNILLARWFRRLVLVCLLLILAGAAGFYFWLQGGPRSIPQAIPYIETWLGEVGQGNTVSIGEAYLTWGGWDEYVTVEVQDVTIRNVRKARLARFASMGLDFDISKIMKGDFVPAGIMLSRLKLRLFRAKEGGILLDMTGKEVRDARKAIMAQQRALEKNPFLIAENDFIGPRRPAALEELPEEGSLGEEEGTLLEQVVAELFGLTAEGRQGQGIEWLHIREADLYLGDLATGLQWHAPNTEIMLRRRDLEIQGAARLFLTQWQEKNAVLEAGLVLWPQDRRLAVRFGLDELRPQSLAYLAPGLEKLANINLPLQADVGLTARFDGTLETGQVAFQGKDGVFHHPDWYPDGLPIKALKAQATFDGESRALQIEQLHLQTDNPLFEMEGKIQWGEEGFENPDFDLAVSMQGLDIAQLGSYWPVSMAEKTRKDMLTIFPAGQVNRATFHLDADAETLMAASLPAEALDLTLDMKDAMVAYDAALPPLKGVEGTVHITGNSLDATINKAQMLNHMTAHDGRVFINDFKVTPPRLQISGGVESTAADIAALLARPIFGMEEEIARLDRAKIAGRFSGRMSLALSLGTSAAKRGLTYAVSGKATDLVLPDKESGRVIHLTDAELRLENNDITLKGMMGLDKTRFPGALTGSLSDNRYHFDFRLPASLLVDSLPHGVQLAGDSELQTSFHLKKDGEIVVGLNADLALLGVRLPLLDYHKPIMEPGRLQATLLYRSPWLTLRDVRLSMPEVSLQGQGVWDMAAEKLGFLEMGSLQWQENKLQSVRYQPLPTGRIDVALTGDYLDMWGMRHALEKRHLPQPLAGADAVEKAVDPMTVAAPWLKNMDISVALERVRVHEKGYLTQLKVKGECNGSGQCMGKIAGSVPESPGFEANWNPGDKPGMRILTVDIRDLGMFLRQFAVLPSLRHGQLKLRAALHDNEPESVVKGEATVTDFQLVDAPILARLLNLLAITTVLDSLQGDGIRFDRLRVPFHYQGGVVDVREARMRGTSLGMTANGTVDLARDVMQLEGVLVPAYVLNRILGAIPLVGEILTGGEGQGVFAANYKVSGALASPEVSVNPLSALAPGFLRNLFSGGGE